MRPIADRRLVVVHPLLFALLLAGSPDSAAAPAGLSAPSSNMLFQLDKQNRGRPWLRVGTATARLELTAKRIDERGLRGLESRAAAPVPANLSWSEITRIDEVVTRRTQGRFLGTLVLGLAGAGLGNALGAPDHQGGKYALIGWATLGTVGRWLGGSYGERFQKERNWYVASTPPVVNTLPVESPAPSEPESSSIAATVKPAVSSHALDVARRIERHDVIRVEGDFGRFQGYAGLAGPDGLERLRGDRKASGQWAGAIPKQPIAWDAIDEIHMRGGSGFRAGLAGALPFGLLGAMLGAAVAGSGSSNASSAEGMAAGFGIAAPIGFLVGAAMGAGVRRWVVVYRRP
jgi:hypothetical protein